MATAKKSSKQSLSARVKIEIIADIEKGEKQSAVYSRLSLPKTTVSTIWKNKEKFKRSFTSTESQVDCKRFRSSMNSDIDAALLEWFKQARNYNIPITAKLLVDKAQVFASAMKLPSFTATMEFIVRWKKRHAIGAKQICGESNSVSDYDVRTWLDATLPELLSQYKPADVYNADETGLFYKLRPDRTLAFKGEKCSDGKKAKDRLPY